jgi:GMP synthase (glutamine-hydrolysing)
MIHRHPFPGPGLGIRIPGEVSAEKVAILQEADHIYIQGLHEHGLYDRVWQAATILLPVKSVGVMGDNRTYQWTCCLRAVAATDAMTAHVSDLPLSFLTAIADKIVRNVDGINRVLYDVTSKPPATIEWE